MILLSYVAFMIAAAVAAVIYPRKGMQSTHREQKDRTVLRCFRRVPFFQEGAIIPLPNSSFVLKNDRQGDVESESYRIRIGKNSQSPDLHSTSGQAKVIVSESIPRRVQTRQRVILSNFDPIVSIVGKESLRGKVFRTKRTNQSTPGLHGF